MLWHVVWAMQRVYGGRGLIVAAKTRQAVSPRVLPLLISSFHFLRKSILYLLGCVIDSEGSAAASVCDGGA